MNLGEKIGLSILTILLGVVLSYLSTYGMNQLSNLINNIKIPESFGGFMEFVSMIGVLILLLLVFAAGCSLSVLVIFFAFAIVIEKIFESYDISAMMAGIIISFLLAVAITFIPDIFTYFKNGNTLSAFKTSYFYDYYSHIKGIKKITTAGLFSGIWLIIKLIFNTILYYGIHVGMIFVTAYIADDLF